MTIIPETLARVTRLRSLVRTLGANPNLFPGAAADLREVLDHLTEVELALRYETDLASQALADLTKVTAERNTLLEALTENKRKHEVDFRNWQKSTAGVIDERDSARGMLQAEHEMREMLRQDFIGETDL